MRFDIEAEKKRGAAICGHAPLLIQPSTKTLNPQVGRVGCC